mgnify:CR=1 FL=1|jgi:hypothetical protein|tara:strand:+ start:798 stop:1568 length:771 start_codon:yes stop_codon:yes gene_type:complete
MTSSTSQKLFSQLRVLKSKYGLEGIKAEFEAEGSSFNDVARLRVILSKLNIKMFVKIGGVEAINDIYNCLELGVDGIIAPMVETKFGAKKFIDIFKKLRLKKNPHLSINIETKTGVKNLNEILKLSAGTINNVTVGRSDLSSSYFKPFITPNSQFILNRIEVVSKMTKKYGITTTVGGGINFETIKTYSKIKKLKSLISRMETRKIILPTKSFLKKRNALSTALKFEELYILYKKEMLDLRISSEISRLSILKTRK